jgi:hypothetical protein
VLEIYIEKDKKIYSSLSDYEELIVYNKVCDSRVHWKDLNIACNSKNDIYAVIYHTRAGIKLFPLFLYNFVKMLKF